METVEDTKENESVWSLHQCRFENVDCGKQSSCPTQSPEKYHIKFGFNQNQRCICIYYASDLVSVCKFCHALCENDCYFFYMYCLLVCVCIYIYMYRIDLSMSICALYVFL